MEEKITKITDLNISDLVKVISPLSGDEVGVVVFKDKTPKYPIENEKGFCRTKTNDKGKIVGVYAKDEGCSGHEEIIEISIMDNVGDYTFNELDDIEQWNIRRIDENHPDFDQKLKNFGNIFNKSINNFFKNIK